MIRISPPSFPRKRESSKDYECLLDPRFRGDDDGGWSVSVADFYALEAS